MWKFLLGFGLGTALGTYYDCKPAIKQAQEQIKHYWPPPKKIEVKEEKKN